MTTTAKIGLVGFGYAVAFVVASAVTTVRIAATAQAAQSSGGMYAFGDTMLFLAVFGAIATLPTAAGLWMLRGYRRVWTALAVVASVGAAGSVAALALYVTGRSAPSGTAMYMWTAWTPLWLLGAPPAALACAGAGLIAPHRAPRAALVLSALIHATVAAGILVLWFGVIRIQ